MQPIPSPASPLWRRFPFLLFCCNYFIFVWFLSFYILSYLVFFIYLFYFLTFYLYFDFPFHVLYCVCIWHWTLACLSCCALGPSPMCWNECCPAQLWLDHFEPQSPVWGNFVSQSCTVLWWWQRPSQFASTMLFYSNVRELLPQYESFFFTLHLTISLSGGGLCWVLCFDCLLI